MATVNFNRATNMNNPDVWSGYVESATTSLIVLTNGYHDQYNYGSFAYDGLGYLVNGTITRIDVYSGGVLDFSARDFALSVFVYDDYASSGNITGLYARVLRGADALFGSALSDTINGYNGNDAINGNGGADRINGGPGNDTVVWGAGDTLNGGANFDTLAILSGDVNLTTAANPNNRLLDFEQIDLRSGAHTLTLNASDVLAMSTTDKIKILGDGGDTVNIAGNQGPGIAAAGGFMRYTIGGATLFIDADITVS